MKTYQLPGFARYRVQIEVGTENIVIQNVERGRTRCPKSDRNWLKRDNNTGISITTIQLVCLAFHGRANENEVTFYEGGGYTPTTVRYITRKKMMRMKRAILSDKQRDHVAHLIRRNKMPYRVIAKKFNCSCTTIARTASECVFFSYIDRKKCR